MITLMGMGVSADKCVHGDFVSGGWVQGVAILWCGNSWASQFSPRCLVSGFLLSDVLLRKQQPSSNLSLLSGWQGTSLLPEAIVFDNHQKIGNLNGVYCQTSESKLCTGNG